MNILSLLALDYQVLFISSLRFRLFDCCGNLFSPAVWHNVNPMLDQRVHFASLHTSQRLLDYLQSSAVVLELWGLQGKDSDPHPTSTSTPRALPYLKCFTVDFTIPEGCTSLVSSLEGVRMTTEGIFIIEEPGKTDSAVRLFSCVSHDITS